MKQTRLWIAAGLMSPAILAAQGQQAQGTAPQAAGLQQYVNAYSQQAATLPAPAAGGRGGGINVTTILRSEAGKPFSATVISESTQTFGDGTKITRKTTTVEHRDAEGRVRMEMTQPDGNGGEMKVITIRDPVANVSYRLDPAAKTGVRTPMAAGGFGVGRSIGGGAMARGGQAPAEVLAGAGGGLRGGGRGGRGPAPAAVEGSNVPQQAGQAMPAIRRQGPGDGNQSSEDLGVANVNGVPAKGTRLMTIIPTGAIGNDREIRIVAEQWFSADLNLLVKSVNTDPRFGTSTYELTNISRQAPDPSLFVPPADYQVSGR